LTPRGARGILTTCLEGIPRERKDSRPFGLLPRQRGLPHRGRPRGRRRPGRALHPEEARFQLPHASGSILPVGRGREGGVRARLRRLLRQAVREVRAAPAELPPRRAQGAPVVHQGDAALAQEQALDEREHRRRARLRRADPLHGAPRVPRRQRVLPFAVRASGDPDDRRRRRVGDREPRGGGGKQDPALEGAPLPALARPALLGVHLLHRLQGQQRRVQAHGVSTLRRAEVRRSHLERDRGSQGRRLAQAQHEVLQLRQRPAHDDRRVRPAL